MDFSDERDPLTKQVILDLQLKFIVSLGLGCSNLPTKNVYATN